MASPDPACSEAQKWIEAVTGKGFGDKDFRSASENGISLCESSSAIKPGSVKKINRSPTPIAGSDNSSVFSRGCEESGSKGSQSFDPGDLQDTSIRANLRDSDCNRKLKNVSNTMFWSGKAASGCASYSGPNLNLKEFEALSAKMKSESDECGDSSQKRSVRDSGYDCWDSERSESSSPPRHTRDNSSDSSDSFGNRSQQSPSPDVVNRGNSDGRGSDSEADASSRKPDVRKDDMLARRTASGEPRCPVPFNQFLPNRTNASCYIPAPRRRHAEDGEQRSHLQTTPELSKRTGPLLKIPKTVTWAPESNAEKLKQGADVEELEQRRVEKLMKAGIKVLPAAVRYSSSPIMEEQEGRSPSPNIILRSENEFLKSNGPARDWSSDGEQDSEPKRVPDVQRDDSASRRVQHIPANSRVHQFVPPPACTSRDRERWEGIRRASQQTSQQKDSSEQEAVSDIITRKDHSLSKEDDEGEEGKETPSPNKQRDDSARRRGQNRPLPQRDGPMSFSPSGMSQADMQKWERLRMSEPSVVMDGSASPPPVELQPWTATPTPTAAEIDARFAQYEQRADEEDEEDEEEAVPDLQRDDMLARRTGAFQKQPAGTTAFNRFSPTPGSRWRHRGEAAADAATLNKKEVKEEMSEERDPRVDSRRPRVPEEAAPQQSEPAAMRATPGSEAEPDGDKDEDGKKQPVPDSEKDDMMARRTRLLQKGSVHAGIQGVSQFSPVPGSVGRSISPSCTVKQSGCRSKPTESMDRESSVVTMAAKHEAPPSKAPTSSRCPGSRGGQEKGHTVRIAEAALTDVTEPESCSSSAPIRPPSPPSPPSRAEEKTEEKNRDGNVKVEKKPSWSEDELPPMMVSRRVAFLLDNQSISMGDMSSEEEAGRLPSSSSSPYERMHQQYNAFSEEEDHWQDDLARWKNRRRSASQESIKKEEERKRMEKRMKEDGVDGSKRKSIKTYKEIVEEKERREAESCEAYRKAATPEEAAMVLQRYALRFIISDATSDSSKSPRSTNKPNQSQNRDEQEHTQTSAHNRSERSEQEPWLAGVVTSAVKLSSAPESPPPKDTNPQNEKLQSEGLPEPAADLHRQHQADGASSQPAPPKPPHPPPPAAPSRPSPSSVARPYCPPSCSPSGHKHVHVQKTDGSVQVNGETTEDVPPRQDASQESVSSTQTQKQHPPEETGDSPTTAGQSEAPQAQTSSPAHSASAISSSIAGRNCIITTTIVTELTKTQVEPLHPDIQNNAQDGPAPAEEADTQPAHSSSSMLEYSPAVSEGPEEGAVTTETPMLNLAKRVNHWVWDPNEERKRLERWQQEQERLLQEQYQKEQDKSKKEWEKAQSEVEEEERKHNEEERRILEETVAPSSPSASVQRQSEHAAAAAAAAAASLSAVGNNSAPAGVNVSSQQNGQGIHGGPEEQHASKLHFLQDSGFDEQFPKKQEMWKTASSDRSPQLNQTPAVRRSGSHDAVATSQELPPSAAQPPSPSRCVSGRRLCSGCSKPSGRGAAMIIDTSGLFFHMQCFKCGVCKGQSGDATAGTDVRIRNGSSSCYECYIASRGRGQPTPL